MIITPAPVVLSTNPLSDDKIHINTNTIKSNATQQNVYKTHRNTVLCSRTKKQVSIVVIIIIITGKLKIISANWPIYCYGTMRVGHIVLEWVRIYFTDKLDYFPHNQISRLSHFLVFLITSQMLSTPMQPSTLKRLHTKDDIWSLNQRMTSGHSIKG